MSHNLSVYVLDSRNRPVQGARVRVVIAGLFSGGQLDEFTDDDGHANFEAGGNYEDSRELHIYVRGEEFGPYEISGGSYTVMLD